MTYNLLILLGGKSSRFSSDINKVYCLINNKPVFTYSLDKFLSLEEIKKIVLVYNKDDLELLKSILKDYHDSRISICEGGKERYDSVLNGLKNLSCDKVIVHDGARPNVSMEAIKDAVNTSKTERCISLGLPITDTIKEVKGSTIKTIDRNNLFSIQTPQITDYDLLLSCLNKIKEEDNITDDLMAIEKYSNVIPKIVIGNKFNYKITVKEDIKLMEYLLGEKNV